MSLLVVALLSLLWLGFFLPSLLEARRTSSPYASATTFQDSLRRLGEPPHGRPQPPGADPAAAPRTSRPAARAARRRAVLAVLSGAVIGGVAIAVAFGGWTVWAAVAPAVALIGYVVMLRRDAVRRAALRTRLTRGTGVGRAAVAAVAPSPPAPPSSPLSSRGDHTDPEIVPSVARRAAAQPPERMAG